MVWTRFVGSKKAVMPIPRYTKDKVVRIKELIEAGRYRAVIDRTYPLERGRRATRYVETETEDRQRRPRRPARQLTRRDGRNRRRPVLADGRAGAQHRPMEIALVLYDGFTALDIVGPFQVLVDVPGVDTYFVAEHRAR